ncbi:protein FAR1-RELATED SEQUENCE 5-like [Camellia sinensis]|uniref:protein FAR1-RELATED SEQUENCE 5-like n=1 Tax=Camellia sinensis TaxID=4442 RepID=UPI001036B81A|nr:protein FAR1-RELATED SEQUENCE 5-like [Camellia sinensis]
MELNNVENEEGDCDWKPRVRMTFDIEQEAYDFYNAYGGRLCFSIRRSYVNKSKEGQITSRQFVCNKEGFRVVDKRDPLTKNPRQEVRTGCQARLVIKWDRNIEKNFVGDFVEQHNLIFVPAECAHMLPSQRKISASQATEIDLAEKSGIYLNAAFELMGSEVGGRELPGFTKLDQKNYLRTKRQNSLVYGEASSILQYFRDKSLENPSFFYLVQLDNEEHFTNIFWADAQMIMDYGQFGDVVTFDTTYKLNSAHKPFASFVGFNHHRETVIFGATLIYGETANSFIWLFRRFLEAMSSKAPKIIFMDQDAAMAKAIPIVMPNTNHCLCTWNLMQNALRHANSIFKDKAVKDKGMKSVLSTFMYNIEDEEEFTLKWEEMLDKYKDEYVKSREVNIEETENDSESTVYTVLDSDGIKVRKVRMECDGSATCNCRKFEMKGILCSHCLKILRDTLKFKEIPSQYILKRWTKKARAENVKDRYGHDIKVDVRLHQTSCYRSLMAIFRVVACRVSESAPEPPPLFSPSIPQSAPLFSSVPQLPPFSPSVPQVRASSSQFMYPAYNPSFLPHNMPFSMSSMYSVHGTYQALLNNASGYGSQASNSPAYVAETIAQNLLKLCLKCC